MRTVWAVLREDEPELFATRELAVAHIEPEIRRWYERAIDPTDDTLDQRMGGPKWRAEQWKGEQYIVELEVIEELTGTMTGTASRAE